MLAKMLDARKTDPINANHHARTTGPQNRIVSLEHLVDCAGDVDRVHRHAPQAVGVPMQNRNDACEPLIKARVCGIGEQLVILDEVDVCGAQAIDDFCRLLRKQADARLDDRSDYWSVVDLSQITGSTDTELRAGELCRVRCW